MADYRDYFNTRITQEMENNHQIGISTKYDDLQQASQEKIKNLAVLKEQQIVNEEARKKTWVGKLNLDPTSVAGGAVNRSASFVSGASRMAGNIASVVPDLAAGYDQLSRSDEQVAAYNRYKLGIESSSDTELLNQKTSLVSSYQGQEATGPTALELFKREEVARSAGRGITSAFDLTSIVDQTKRDRLSTDLGKNFDANWDQTKSGFKNALKGNIAGAGDTVAGLAKLVFTAGESALSNPGASLEYITENIPQLATGLFGKAGMAAMTAANVGYAADNFQQGIQNYQKENNGALPPLEKRQEMAAYAASLALAENVGDHVGLGLMNSGTKDAARIGFKESLKNVAKAGAEGFVSEAGTEGYQTFAEGEATQKPATALGIYQGAVIGGVSGAGMSAGGRAVSEVAQATPEHIAKQAKVIQEKVDHLKAMEAGDTSVYLDPKSKQFDPVKGAQVLYGNSQKETTTPEAKAKNLEQANKIVSDLQDKRNALQDASPEGIAENKKMLVEQQAQLDDATTPEEISQAQDMIDLLGASIKDAESMSPSQQKANAASLAKIDQYLEGTRKVKDALTQMVQPQESDVQAQVAVADTMPDAKDTKAVAAHSEAVASILNMSMIAPHKVSVEAATQLADNQANGLTEAQRTHLRAFSAARLAQNELMSGDKVAQHIYTGGGKDVGIAQYMAQMSEAISTNNQKVANRALAGLTAFAKDHQAKSDAAQAAEKTRVAGSPAPQIIRTNAGTWMVADRRYSDKEIKANGGFTLNSAWMVDNFQTEADALKKSAAALKSTYTQKFGTPEVNSTTPVNSVDSQAANAAPSTSSVPTKGQTQSNKDTNVDSKEASTTVPAPVTVKDTNEQQKEAGTASTSTGSETDTAQEPTGSNEGNTTEVKVAPTTLSKLEEKSPEGTEYKKRNLLADFFTQVAGSDLGTQRPLVIVKDFLSKAAKGTFDILDFTKQKGEVMGDPQIAAWNKFREMANVWESKIQENLFRRADGKTLASDFFHENVLQFLIDSTLVDGKPVLNLEENIKTAISYAAFSWIAENATRAAYNTDEEINLILGRDEDHVVSESEKRDLLYIGTRQNVIANSLGQRAVAALGLKAGKDAPANIQAQLESTMGMFAAKILLDDGILERTVLTPKQMQALTQNGETDAHAKHNFIKMVRGEAYALNPKAEAIFQSNRGSKGFLDKLFSVEAGLKEPSDKPIPFKQKTTNNSNQGIPTTLEKVITEKQAEANYVRQDMWNVVNRLDDVIALEIAGVASISEKDTHKFNRDSIKAKNDGLTREYGRMKEFFGSMQDMSQAMYFEYSVWKQQRVGIATNAINPQSSKIHRFMIYRQAWETKVDMNNQDQMDNFRLRVLEGLGTKTDKQANAKSLTGYEAKTGTPEIKAAVAVLVKTLKDEELTAEDQQVLLAGVKQGGENFHSLDALMALAQYELKKEYKQTEFTVQMMGEVDGVTNGPMLTHLALGAARSVEELFVLLNRGGFYEEDNEHTNYNVWRGAGGHLDLYEKTIRDVLDRVQKLTKAKDKTWVNQNILNSVYAFTGMLENKEGGIEKDGRNIIKTPLTAMVFGSATSSAIDSMADKFIESIYGKIEATAKGKKGALSKVELLKHLKMLGVSINPSVDLMEHEFDKDQVAALKGAFKNTLGKAVQATMETNFADFIAKRKEFNKTAQLSFELYNAAYTGIKESYVAELVASGDMAVTDAGKPIHALTKLQEQELRSRVASLAPIMNSLMSKDSQGLSAGLAIGKTARKMSSDPTFSSEITFGVPFADGTKRANLNSQERVDVAPGVSMLPIDMHSTDSAISHYAAEGHEVLNVHDAHGTGLATFEATARNLNQATWNAMLNYSPATEMFNAMSRTVLGLAELLQNKNTPPQVTKNLVTALVKFAEKSETNPVGQIITQMLDTKTMSFQADTIKLQALQQMGSVDQYALQGGNYVVTPEDRAAAKEMEAKLSKELTTEEKAAIQLIENLIEGEIKKEFGKRSGATALKEAMDSLGKEKKSESIWGELGTPAIKSDERLLKLFKQRGEVTASQLFKLFDGNMKSEIDARIWGLMQRVVDPNLVIKMVTSQTQLDQVLETGADMSRGWYVSKNGDEAIYVLSPEFKYSGLNMELLMHEMLHASLARTIEQAQKDGKGPAFELVQELEALRTQAQAFVTKMDLKGYTAALTNVHELVSWGMSNKDFQHAVLNQLSMESKTKGNPLVTGMKRFIDIITGLLFKNATKTLQAQAANGMTILINNVSGLFYQAGQDKSTKADVNLSQIAAVNDYTTIDLYESLNTGTLDPAFDANLRELLEGIVTKVHGPFGTLKADRMEQQAISPMDIYFKAKTEGVLPFASQSLNAGFQITEQEAFVLEQVEATIRATLDGTNGQTSITYTELAKLYREVEAKLTPADFTDPALYDFVFKMEKSNGDRSDYLARFAALGLANQEFNKLLQMATKRDSRSLASMGFIERLEAILSRALAWFSGKMTHTFEGQQADEKLTALVDQLISIESRRKAALLVQADNKLAPIEEAIKGMAKGAREKAEAFGNSALFKNSKNGFVAATGSLISTAAGERVDALFDGYSRLRERQNKENLAIDTGIINEIRGANKTNMVFHWLLRESKRREQIRENAITDTSSVVLNSFANKGENLTKEDKAAISAVILRTDMSVLQDHFSMSQIQNMLNDPAALKAAITNIEGQLAQFKYHQLFYVAQSKDLGYRLATGAVKGKHVLMNANNIAQTVGTHTMGKVTEAQRSIAEPLIDQLTTLYAIQYSKPEHKVAIRNIVNTETARGTESGIEMVLKMHKTLQQQSKERLFEGNEALMMKGYVPEIYNPHREVLIANALDGAKLVAQGYKEMVIVAADPRDPNQQVRRIYTRDGGGLRSYLTGIMSYTGTHAKGSRSATQNVKDLNEWKANRHDLQAMHNAKQADIRSIFNTPLTYDPSKVTDTYAAPVVNSKGEVSDYRYLMQEQNKDSLLDRDNRFDKIMGAFAGSIYDKETTKEINNKAVQALKDQFTTDFKTRSESYVRIGLDSPIAAHRDIYRLLPDATKNSIKAIWGSDHMMVRLDLLDINFGYRKSSLTGAFDKDSDERNFADKFLVDLSTHIWGEKAEITLRRSEDIWQELVRETKDIRVVKNVSTLVGNVISNASLLFWIGVPVKDALFHHRVALKGVTDFRKDSAALADLKIRLEAGHTQGNVASMQREIVRLEDALERNPVKKMIDAGLMPTIVEDVSAENDLYSYKSRFVQKTEKYTSKLNPHVMAAGRQMYMAKDTFGYQALNHATQLSDFVARYTLYQYVTTRKDLPMSHEDAIQFASDAFVNYDIPSHRTVQYLNDMGAVWFTKYYIRIQKVIGHLYAEHPGRAIALLALKHYFPNMYSVTDSGFTHKIGHNPFSDGALQFPGALDELATVKVAMSPFN